MSKDLVEVQVGMSVKLEAGDCRADGDSAVGFSGYAVPGTEHERFWTSRERAEKLCASGVAVRVLPMEEPTEEAAEEVLEEWTLKSSPEAYLKRSPDGPQAELARRILGLE